MIVGLLAAAVFSPVVQPWALEKVLNAQPGVRASVGAVWAGWSDIEIENLRLERDGRVLTVPNLKATCPWLVALWTRQVAVTRLAAKGWTLDLSRSAPNGSTATALPPSDQPTSAGTATEAVTRTARTAFPAQLTGWKFPGVATLDGVDLEGDVIVRLADDAEPSQTHVVLKGGGGVAGAPTEFEATGFLPVMVRWIPAATIGWEGRLTLALGAGRSVERIAFTGRVRAPGVGFPDDMTVALSANQKADGSEDYTGTVSRGERPMATMTLLRRPADGHLQGDWRVDAREADVTGLVALRLPARTEVKGEGAWAFDPAGGRWESNGRLQAQADGWEVVKTDWKRFGPTRGTVDFSLSGAGAMIDVQRLAVDLGGARLRARLGSLQAFRWNTATGELALDDPARPCVEGVLEALPLDWLDGIEPSLALRGGDLAGAFKVSREAGRWKFQTTQPLRAAGVEIRRGSDVIVREVDLDLTLGAGQQAAGWEWHAAPLVIARGGQTLLRVEGKLSALPERARRWAFEGAWTAEPGPLLPADAVALGRILKGRTLAGTAKGKTGTATDAELTLRLKEPNGVEAIAAKWQVYLDAWGKSSFRGPVTLKANGKAAELTVQGLWAAEKNERHFDLDVSGVKVDSAAVRDIAGPWWAAMSASGNTSRTDEPFWGAWRGRAKFGCYQLMVDGRELHEVSAAVAVEPGRLRLEAAQGLLAPPQEPAPAAKDRARRPTAVAELKPNPVSATGEITFEAGAARPYRYAVAGRVAGIGAKAIWGEPAPGLVPDVEGKFAIEATLSGSSRRADELFSSPRTEYRITGENGIFRFLDVNVAAAIPDKATPVADALGTARMAVGTILGMDRNLAYSGVRKLDKPMESVLNFSYLTRELRYDRLIIETVREPIGPVKVAKFELNSPNVRLTGEGRIDWADGKVLADQPVSLELRIGVRENFADLLTDGRVVGGEKDAGGFKWVPQPVRFGGTLGHLDNAAWRDLLAAAAVASPKR